MKRSFSYFVAVSVLTIIAILVVTTVIKLIIAWYQREPDLVIICGIVLVAVSLFMWAIGVVTER